MLMVTLEEQRELERGRSWLRRGEEVPMQLTFVEASGIKDVIRQRQATAGMVLTNASLSIRTLEAQRSNRILAGNTVQHALYSDGTRVGGVRRESSTVVPCC
jgi:hypothetical protein